MSSDNPIFDAAEGATKGVLEWSTEKITDLIRKLKDKKLAFIEEKRTIEIVKEQYNSGEAKFYKKYIKNEELLLLARMGLTLRRLENDEERLQNLRDKLFRKYGASGLHIAEFVQNHILNRYFGILIEELTSGDDLEKKIIEVLKNIEKHTLFVLGTSTVAEVFRRCITIVDSHSPSIFVIAGFGSAAKIVQDSITPLENVMNNNYQLERFSGGDREILFFRRKLNKL